MKPNFTKNKKRGFTAVEMLAVLTIVAIMSSIVIFNYGKFTSSVILSNMAYEIALVARQAQTFGLAARPDLNSTSIDFTDSRYGIFLDISGDGNTRDINIYSESVQDALGSDLSCNKDNGVDDCDCNEDECFEKLSMQRNIVVDQIAFPNNAGVCNLTEKVSVSFERPNPEAVIYDQESGGSIKEVVEIRVIALSADNINPRYVVIRKSGQIDVRDNSLCNSITTP